MKVNEGLVVVPVGMLKSQSIIYYMGFREGLCKLARIISVWKDGRTYRKQELSQWAAPKLPPPQTSGADPVC